MPQSLPSPLPSRRPWRVPVAVLATAVGLCLAVAPLAEADSGVGGLHDLASLPSFAPLVKKVMPAVVNISVQEKSEIAQSDQGQEEDQGSDQDDDQDQQDPDQGQQAPGNRSPGARPVPGSPLDQFLRRFFDQQQQGRNFGGPAPTPHDQQRVALGSGFIIDPTGFVVTNNHVVDHADKVTVIFQDDSRHPAKVIGRDTKTDLALLKIETDHPLPFVTWGDSNAAQVGDWVLAVGNPFGLGGTVSTGIISARGLDIRSGPYDDFLQIDASINRGNSGGPTFNIDGQVIGINTAIYSPNGGSVGIGFAIPSSLAKSVIDQIKDHGKVQRGWLGVQIQEVTPEIAESFGLAKPEGALVADVTADSPAAKAGFKQGDVITAFNGHDIKHVRDLPIMVAQTPVGQKSEVKIWRKDGPVTLSATIVEMPKNLEQVADNSDNGDSDTPDNASALGLRLAPLSQQTRQRYHVPKDVQGVVVTSIANSSPLNEIGIQAGDVIQQIDQKTITTPEEAVAEITAARGDKGGKKPVVFLINRHGTKQFIALKSPKSGDNG